MTRHPFKTERAAAIHMARVYLAQARCARHRHQWHAMDWNRLFARMQVGNSVVLPRSAHSRISKAKLDSKRAGGPEFSIRLIDAEKLRLWRIK